MCKDVLVALGIALAAIALIGFVVFGLMSPRGEALDVWTETVTDKQHEGSRSGSGVGVTGGGNVAVVSTHTSAKYHVITERDIYSVSKDYYMRVQEGDEVRIGKFKTLFGITVIVPVGLEG